MSVISQALTEEQRKRIKEKIDRARAMADTRERVIPEFATPPDGIQCQHCGNTGWTYEITDDGYESVRACPYCYERRQVVRRLQHSGISPLQSNYVFPGENAGQRQNVGHGGKVPGRAYIRWPGIWRIWQQRHGEDPYLHRSLPGAYPAVPRATPLFFMPGLVKASKSFKDDYEAEMQKWVRYQNLYIDDMFKFSGKQAGDRIVIDQDELRVFFDLINARYLSHKTTLFSSEYTVKAIAAIDGALGSRIYDMVKPYGLAVSGPNQRLVG